MQHIIDAEDSDLFDVLAQYVRVGVEELSQDKLSPLFRLKYHGAIADAVADLGQPEEMGKVFFGFQRYLYQPPVQSGA